MFWWKKEGLPDVSYYDGLSNECAQYTVPRHWIEETNATIDLLKHKVKRLETELAALTSHLGVTFKDIPAEPAKVTVANVVAAY